jgi:hypothetical protein
MSRVRSTDPCRQRERSDGISAAIMVPDRKAARLERHSCSRDRSQTRARRTQKILRTLAPLGHGDVMQSNEGAQGGSVTGHSRKDVEAILDAHYLGMTTKARRVRPCKAGARRRRQREPMANKNCKTIRPFQMRPGISS